MRCGESKIRNTSCLTPGFCQRRYFDVVVEYAKAAPEAAFAEGLI